jgi:ABC-type sugar transport system ATPase subunit
MTLADRVAVMRAGRLEQVAAPEEVHRRPLTRFVAEFVGSPRMNLADAAGRTAGIRPEDVDLGTEGLEADVVLRESLGSQELLTVRRGDRELRALVRTGAVPGPRTRVRLDPARVHAFDREGRRCAPDAALVAALLGSE